MAVNPLNPAVSYSINASNETADNSKQRRDNTLDKKQQRSRPKPAATELTSAASESGQEAPKDSSASELTSQIIDSETVIELLAHRPKLKRSVQNCFITLKKSEQKSQIADVKKLNKAF